MSYVQPLTVLLPVLYLAAALLYGMTIGGPRAPEVRTARRAAILSAIGVHVLYFATLWRVAGHFPVTDVWTSLSAVAWGTAGLYAGLARGAGQHGTGVIVLGVVFLLQLGASSFGEIDPHALAAGLAGKEGHYAPHAIVHVLTSVAATATLALSGIHGALYIFVYRGMRRRSFGALQTHMPPLEDLALLTRRSALLGFLFLAVGLNVGIWMAHGAGVPGFRYTDPYVLVMLFLWIHFGVIAFSSVIPGFTARRASWAAAGGFVVLLLSLIASWLPSLSFHWRS